MSSFTGITWVLKKETGKQGRIATKKATWYTVLLHSALSRGFGSVNRKCTSLECFVAQVLCLIRRMWDDVLYHSPVLLCCTINTNMNFYDMCDIPCLMSEWSLNNSTLCSSDVKSHSYSSIKSPSRLAALIAWVLKFDVCSCMNMSHFIVLCCLIPLSNHVTTCKKKNHECLYTVNTLWLHQK